MTADPETEAVRLIVDDLLSEGKARVIEFAGQRQGDHPLDREAAENVLVVLQELEMLASLRKNLGE